MDRDREKIKKILGESRENEDRHLQIFNVSVMINLSIQLRYTLVIVIYIRG